MFVFTVVILVASFKLVLEFGQNIEMEVYDDGTTSLDEYRDQNSSKINNQAAQLIALKRK